MVVGLQSFVYEEPSSPLVTAMSAVTLLLFAYLGFAESTGKQHLQYSKFWNVSSGRSSVQQIKLSSRAGMLILYAPAFLAGISSFWFYPNDDSRFVLLKLALTLHFLKRVLEVLFVHKYSGNMILGSVIFISSCYLMSVVGMNYSQQFTKGSPEPPSVDLKYVGVVLFLVGICGNFYHHCILSKLRDNEEKVYKIPKGGFFNLVICPHYLFEILGFIGIFCISQTLFSFSGALSSAIYLIGRSYATRKWYLSKFENFPKNVKALVPYVF